VQHGCAWALRWPHITAAAGTCRHDSRLDELGKGQPSAEGQLSQSAKLTAPKSRVYPYVEELKHAPAARAALERSAHMQFFVVDSHLDLGTTWLLALVKLASR
jgi:hypothetical protein